MSIRRASSATGGRISYPSTNPQAGLTRPAKPKPKSGSGDQGFNALIEAFAENLVAQMLQVSGGPGAYRDPDVLAVALKRIDPELPRRLAASIWWDAE